MCNLFTSTLKWGKPTDTAKVDGHEMKQKPSLKN